MTTKYICEEDLRYMTDEEKSERIHTDLYHVGGMGLDWLLDEKFAEGLRIEKMKKLKHLGDK
jgi:hypothetical protein